MKTQSEHCRASRAISLSNQTSLYICLLSSGSLSSIFLLVCFLFFFFRLSPFYYSRPSRFQSYISGIISVKQKIICQKVLEHIECIYLVFIRLSHLIVLLS